MSLREEPWEDVPGWAAATAGGLFGLFFLLVASDDDGYVRILDDANLAFHEAGHPIFGLFGETLGLYGGTLMQLLLPLAVTMTFATRRWPVSYAVGLVWVGENLLNIARYMADAREQVLPLAGGGEHDWWHIFVRWGVLHHDTRIARVVQGMGWLLMLGAAAWVVWRWWQGRPTPEVPERPARRAGGSRRTAARGRRPEACPAPPGRRM